MADARDLLGGNPAPARTGGHGGARPGSGRKPGALSRVNQELREYLVQLTGSDAIVEQYRLASLPLMAEDEQLARDALAKIVRRFRCSRTKAAELWLKAADLVYPHVYPKLGSIDVKRDGAPGGGGGWPFDFDGDAVDVTDLQPLSGAGGAAEPVPEPEDAA